MGCDTCAMCSWMYTRDPNVIRIQPLCPHMLSGLLLNNVYFDIPVPGGTHQLFCDQWVNVQMPKRWILSAHILGPARAPTGYGRIMACNWRNANPSDVPAPNMRCWCVEQQCRCNPDERIHMQHCRLLSHASSAMTICSVLNTSRDILYRI